MNTTKDIDIDILKALALKQHLEEPYFEFEGQYYEGTRSKSELVPPYNSDDYNNDYLVLTDSEANDKWEEYLDSYIDDLILPEIPEYLQFYFDEEAWKIDAKRDGRGHSLSSYDGNEYEVTIEGETFYIYRIN